MHVLADVVPKAACLLTVIFGTLKAAEWDARRVETRRTRRMFAGNRQER